MRGRSGGGGGGDDDGGEGGVTASKPGLSDPMSEPKYRAGGGALQATGGSISGAW